MGPFPYCELQQIVSEGRSNPALLVLDGIQDSFNLGAMVRSAAAFGIQGLLLGTQGQSPITSQAARRGCRIS
jgi:23S rRNA (guanosine2251-2'-O)-methyltransferase